MEQGGLALRNLRWLTWCLVSLILAAMLGGCAPTGIQGFWVAADGTALLVKDSTIQVGVTQGSPKRDSYEYKLQDQGTTLVFTSIADAPSRGVWTIQRSGNDRFAASEGSAPAKDFYRMPSSDAIAVLAKNAVQPASPDVKLGDVRHVTEQDVRSLASRLPGNGEAGTVMQNILSTPEAVRGTERYLAVEGSSPGLRQSWQRAGRELKSDQFIMLLTVYRRQDDSWDWHQAAIWIPAE